MFPYITQIFLKYSFPERFLEVAQALLFSVSANQLWFICHSAKQTNKKRNRFIITDHKFNARASGPTFQNSSDIPAVAASIYAAQSISLQNTQFSKTKKNSIMEVHKKELQLAIKTGKPPKELPDFSVLKASLSCFSSSIFD